MALIFMKFARPTLQDNLPAAHSSQWQHRFAQAKQKAQQCFCHNALQTLQLLCTDVDVEGRVLVQVVASLHQQGGGWDSANLASHLERLGRKGELVEGWQLALDMYARLGMHDRHCQMLLAKVRHDFGQDASCEVCCKACRWHGLFCMCQQCSCNSSHGLKWFLY